MSAEPFCSTPFGNQQGQQWWASAAVAIAAAAAAVAMAASSAMSLREIE
eukprot:CAMPEP_0177175554 /NCGR_PEP_ID=MMETSP0367-20130122/12771_1 /TAXON_ID=447022 ORGANISM="Scrippsiella hangoei-like, Strain SHHI-4" /NCGR_SAMPLE_ID=MMETSP0367 /ASSEMBLY_ACC=CAM_ASM_000362 /LENGTH=48 /DNA_ID= /DNA_START= /DNA_END= /DNA_ORIENTATION=